MKKVVIIALPITLILALISLLIINYYFGVKVELNGLEELTHEVNTEYKDAGFSLKVNNKELSEEEYKYEVENNVKSDNLGKYNVKYHITYKNKTYDLERTIKVIDSTKPDLKINVNTIEKDYCTENILTKVEYSAIDNHDGDITANIKISDDKKNITYSIKDSSGNENNVSLPITYTSKPKSSLTLQGKSTIYVPINTKYEDEGAIYTDGCKNKLSEKIIKTGKVDTSKIGTYTLTYTLEKDGSSVKRKVIVYTPNITKTDDNSNERIIYLTFDDGPCAYTQKVLDILDKYNIKATFFVTHQFAKYVPMIEKEYKKGHSVGVHTYTHKWSIYTSLETYLDDFNKMNNDVEKYTGQKTKIFRFPGGSSNRVSKRYATGVISAIASHMNNEGYVYFDWNVDSGDAAGATSAQIYKNVVNGVTRCKNCVVLMHDIKKNTVNELDEILKTLTSKGYKFGTLSTESKPVHHTINN